MNYDRFVDYMNSKQGFNTYNHIETKAIGEGYAEIVIDLRPESLNNFGVAHGSLLFALGDVATGVAAVTGGRSITTQSANINFLRPVTSGRVTAVSKRIKEGRNTCIYEAEIYDEANRLICKGTYNMFYTGRISQRKDIVESGVVEAEE